MNRRQYLPTEIINGFPVRPGNYLLNGATPLGDTINFTVRSSNATACSVALFRRRAKEPFAVIPIPDNYRIGDTWSIMIFGLDIRDLEYCYRLDGPYHPEKGLIFEKDRNVLDPYARAVTGQSVWGVKSGDYGDYHARVYSGQFDWGDYPEQKTPLSDLIIYEMHVRGFTKDKSSGVKHGGTFDGIIEKIPYLKKLGVNAVELMPVFEFDEMDGARIHEGRQLLNYWGYNTTCFFAPNTSYSSRQEENHEGEELKILIKKLNENGMQVFLDVVFNHTSEGDEHGPAFSFKGLDNSVYYMLTPDGKYYNFSGCGNTFNCNHPVVQQFILDCLRHWVIEYRVDGFRFDLASILGRSEDGSPMLNPPLLKNLAYDPILRRVKLIAEAWDAGGLYQVGSFPSWKRWAEWNGKYRDDLRAFLKGDNGRAWSAAQRIMGSRDIYPPELRGHDVSVNFITCHDGFTLYDLYSYNRKHNEMNGWNNTDGDNAHDSWNCGIEGDTDNQEVRNLRIRMVKNAFAVLLCSRGAAMFPAGDEFCNTQFGNNNAYCQDNEISWLDWSRKEEFHEIFDFVRDMIAFRKAHRIIRQDTDPCSMGFPSMSVHNSFPWNQNFRDDTHVLGIMFAGKKGNGQDDVVFLAINAHWESQPVQLPDLPDDMEWNIKFYTDVPYTRHDVYHDVVSRKGNTFMLAPRSVMVLVNIKKR
ncbi:MAG: glycogen debranching enzyme [Oscillospiraceae bacterium]|nr:glycogen debranching enzyme [Oscillospiraceae bacterium]